ncbi:Ger(x)C family spore germination protein [Clostridium sp. 'deep sea']|uniref:Ger(x)C family spore germination protein n=1 Tax=Clostridium sp. 'deep sea' TaxID=2779445 RepID=UPI001896797B|nr:Ger(x)C family spore germination protein [Clostridium sp. 'deep sea']QOR34859.1 Ger(x)C family spore germination protein [Clostridium sp. 'deep sea']
MNKKIKKYGVILIILAVIYLYFGFEKDFLPIEELDIPSGVGIDLVLDELGNIEYSVPISFYNYGEEEKISSLTHTGYGSTIPETRETRQLISSKKMILGIERVLMFSEDASRAGIKSYLEIFFKNPNINDTALVSICKGKCEDILNYKVPEYPSAADYIAGILEHSTEFNFFSHKYILSDVFICIASEGKNIALPYIEVKDDKLQITGMALFKEDKMVKKLDMDQVKVMNILRENNVKGMLTLQSNLKEYIGYFAKTKRKVKCEKKDETYTFFIDLSFNGDIIDNSLFDGIHKDEDTMKKFEKNMKEHVEKICNDFITDMQQNLKFDCLRLGHVAAAKYGRHTGVDWNEIVCKSTIKVNVKIKVDKMGRGDY